MKKTVLYSIVIPVYGTSKSLIELSKRISDFFDKIDSKDYEIIFVNDCSPNQDTEIALKYIFEKNSKTQVISLSRNFGQQAATICGIAYCSGDYVITMDDDLQHNPEHIELFFKHDSHDVVIASFPQKEHSLSKRLMSDLKGYFDHLILNKPSNIQLTAFRMIKQHIAIGLKDYNTPYPFIPAILFSLTNDIVNVDVPHYKREEGYSQYDLWKMIRLFSNLLINNSYLLLRVIGLTGIMGLFLSLLISTYLIIRYVLFGFNVVGWASQILTITFFGGLNLFGIGVIGEYLVRILSNLERKNMYYVKSILKH